MIFEKKEYDVVIAGGGPAGIGAALGAAKTGVKTLLVEKCGFKPRKWMLLDYVFSPTQF